MMKPRRFPALLAIAAMTASLVSVSFSRAVASIRALPPAATKTSIPINKPLHAGELGACSTVPDVTSCVLAAIEKVDPSARDAEVFAPLHRAPIGNDAIVLAAYRELMAAPDRGESSRSALAKLGTGSPILQTELPAWLCAVGAGPLPTNAGAKFSAWYNAVRPPRALTIAAADELEKALGAKTNPNNATTSFMLMELAACRAGLGDDAAMERALSLAPDQDRPTLRLTSLSASGRFKEALDLAGAQSTPTGNGPDELKQWNALQRARSFLLTAAIQSGHDEVADRAAEIILGSVLTKDRPISFNSDTGLPAALEWLLSRPDSDRAIRWTQTARDFVRPGMPGWNYADVVEVYRALKNLGMTDQALALYDEVIAEAASPPIDPTNSPAPPVVAPAVKLDPTRKTPQPALTNSQAPGVQSDAMYADAIRPNAYRTRAALGHILAVNGQTEEARAMGYYGRPLPEFFLPGDLTSAHVKDRLATTKTPDEKLELLAHCAALGQSRKILVDGTGGLDLAAECVRDAAALTNPQAGTPNAAVYKDLFFLAGPALQAADAAVRADRLDLARELLGLVLLQWRAPAFRSIVLDSRTIDLLIEITSADRRFRA